MTAEVYEVNKIGDHDTKVIVAIPVDKYEYMMSIVKLFSDFAQFNTNTHQIEIKKKNITGIISKLCGSYCEDWVITE